MDVYTSSHRRVPLREPPIGAGGGEGAIYELAEAPGLAAKIYHSASKAAAREEKIRRMIGIGRTPAFRAARLAERLAWPQEQLFDGKGRFIGYSMPLIQAVTDLDELCAYPSPRGDTMTMKLVTLQSLCNIYEALHALGLAVGDGNPQNILVLADRSAALVDTDSIHIDGTSRCSVCAPGYAAPELLRKLRRTGTTYETCAGESFTPAADRFALAVNIFRTLARAHPFFCRLTDRADSGKTPTVEDRIVRGETPFFTAVPGADVPVYAPDLRAALPPYILELFRRAFLEAPELRPSPGDWSRALERFREELTDCPRDRRHMYWQGGGRRCPYCEADRRYRAAVEHAAGRRVPPRPVPRPAAPSAAVSPPAAVPASFRPGAAAGRTAAGRLSTTEVRFWIWTMVPAAAIVGLCVPVMLLVYGRGVPGVILCVLHAGLSIGASVCFNLRFGRPFRWWKGVLSVLCAPGAMLGVVAAVLGAWCVLVVAGGFGIVVGIFIGVMALVWKGLNALLP